MATSDAAVRAPVSPGDVLAGKYRVERVLGVGGMGVVVAARHLQLDERVALKFLREKVIDEPEIVVRFLREARAVAKLRERSRRARARRRQPRERRAVHRDGAARGGDAEGAREARRRAAEGAGRGLRAAGVQRDRRGALARHRPPRHQADEPVSHVPPRRPRAREGARLRHLEAAPDARGPGRGARHDGDDEHARIAALHVARADGLGAQRRRAHRHLVARRHALSCSSAASCPSARRRCRRSARSSSARSRAGSTR